MLTNVLKVLINNSFKESFYGKRKEKINILTAFFIFYKNCVKTFLKLIVKQYLKSIRQHDKKKKKKKKAKEVVVKII